MSKIKEQLLNNRTTSDVHNQWLMDSSDGDYLEFEIERVKREIINLKMEVGVDNKLRIQQLQQTLDTLIDG
jgi:hypothetical protein